MIKVLVSDGLSPEGVEILTKEGIVADVRSSTCREELLSCIREYDGLIVRSATKVDADVIEAGNHLRVIGRAGTGLDNIDVPAASKKGIVVMNTPGANTITTAEHTISMMLALSRNIPQANASMKQRKWDRKRFEGVELSGKTLGIIGIGRVGSEVAKRARKGFNMRVIAYDPYLSTELAAKMEIELVELERLLRESNYISIHAALTSDTRHLLDAKNLAQVKKGVRIVNCARGEIIDEKALYDAIQSGQVAGAALDVFEAEPPPPDFPLLNLDNVICTPHLGASTKEAQINVSIAIAEQIAKFLNRGIAINAANFPSISPESVSYLTPFLSLAEKLGSFVSQWSEGHMEEVYIQLNGEILNHDTAPIPVAVLKGLLDPITSFNVNFVNAPIIAKERGIQVVESKISGSEHYPSLLTVILKTNKGTYSVAGTIFGKNDLKLVRVDHLHVEADPEGYMLIHVNKDIPGMIGKIGTILGNARINIAAMQLGREKQGGMAISILTVDDHVPEEVLAKIREIPDIFIAKLIKI
jgi:D-3-phosphoglycerate dehydrogenase